MPDRKKRITPGPWEVMIGGNFLAIYQLGKMKPEENYLGRENFFVAGVKTPSMTSVKSYIPDAFLIAAAPDLYKAAKDLILVTRGHATKKGRVALDKLWAAVKKVERWKDASIYKTLE